MPRRASITGPDSAADEGRPRPDHRPVECWCQLLNFMDRMRDTFVVIVTQVFCFRGEDLGGLGDRGLRLVTFKGFGRLG